MEYLIFNKPKTNIQRAFGLFAQLEKMGFSRGPLNPSEQFIVLQKKNRVFYSTSQETQCTCAQDIPSNYSEIVNNFVNN